MEDPLEIFFSYAHEDEDLMNDVRRQLVVYERNGRILKWHDRMIPPGTDWRQRLDERLEKAKIILLFVSPYFIESNYCYEVEGQAALRRYSAGEAKVVPVILRPCSWEETPFGKLQALPRGGKPVSRWEDRDEACLNVAIGVMKLVDELIATRSPQEARVTDSVSIAGLSSFRCTSPLCRSQDLEFTDVVEISSLKADAVGWIVQGTVEIDYCVHGLCRTCGRIFEAAKRQIPIQFPDLTCNECDRRAFLQYKVQELRRVGGGFEFTVEIRCSGCQGRKKLTKLLTGLLSTIGISIGLDDIHVKKAA
jgi:DNA-directed RNA polymerase subunit RPC12/RpoP